MHYIDINKNKFTNLSNYYNNVSSEKVKNRKLLNSKRLIVLNQGKEVYSTNNIQSLYLYPLNILDYVKYAKEKKTLMYNILNIDGIKNNYNNLEIEELKNVEILVDKENLKQFSEIVKFSQILKKKNKLVSFNLKTLNIDEIFLKKLCDIGDYFKVRLSNFENEDDYKSYLNKINQIKKWCNQDSVIHIKGYLEEKQVKYYEKLVRDTKENVDIIQISKELIPISYKTNPKVSNDVIDKIRALERTNENFISVKDLKTLYYPRFELDERNSHKCYVWYIKPYIKDNYILPCKVNKVIKNIDDWKVREILSDNNSNVIKYGKKCDDCASIFENDTLAEIIEFYNKGYDFLLEIDEK